MLNEHYSIESRLLQEVFNVKKLIKLNVMCMNAR
jgi:hypothetical protein